MPKTGSTALQIALVRNREELAKRGLTYPEATTDRAALAGRVMSGNAVGVILKLLASPVPMPQGIDDVRRRVASSATPCVLWSSEALYRQTRVDRLQELAEGLARDEIGISVVGFVRDLAGHALSSHSQMVKRSLLTHSFREYLDGSAGQPVYNPDLRRSWGGFVKALGRENVSVLRYESHRDRLMDALLEGLQVSAQSLISPPEAGVNRSMTARELLIMREVNRQLSDPRQGKRISDALIGLPPVGESSPGLTLDDLALLRRRFESEVDWMNSTFLLDDPMSVAGAVSLSERHDDVDPLTSQERELVTRLVAGVID